MVDSFDKEDSEDGLEVAGDDSDGCTEVEAFGFLPSWGLSDSVASSLRWAILHADQLYTANLGSLLAYDPIFTWTWDLLGLETIGQGPSNLG